MDAAMPSALAEQATTGSVLRASRSAHLVTTAGDSPNRATGHEWVAPISRSPSARSEPATGLLAGTACITPGSTRGLRTSEEDGAGLPFRAALLRKSNIIF